MKQSMIHNFKYYQLRENILIKVLNIMNKQKTTLPGGTVLIGDSLIELIPHNLLPNNWINNGIGGMCSSILCNLVDELVNKFKPSRVILHIGTNDLGDTVMESPRDIMMNIRDLVDMIQANNSCDITLVSCLVCNEDVQASWVLKTGIRSNELIRVLNQELEYLATNKSINFINLSELVETHPNFNSLLVEDGLHLSPDGYSEIINFIKQKYSHILR